MIRLRPSPLNLVVMAVMTLLVACAADAGAQVRSLGVSNVGPFTLSTGSERGLIAVAFDDKADVSLYAWFDTCPSRVCLNGRFVRFDGTFAGDVFPIATGLGPAGLGTPVVGVRAAYSRGSGDDVFAVVYHDTFHDALQFARYTGVGATGGSLVGAPIAMPGAADVVFNPATNQFAVAAVCGQICVQLFATDGTPATAAVDVTSPRCCFLYEPRLAVDSEHGRLAVSFIVETIFRGGSAYLYGFEADEKILDATTAVPLTTIQTFFGCGYSIDFFGKTISNTCGGFTNATAVTYLPDAGKFLAVWSSGSTVSRVLIGQDGSLAAPVAVITGASAPTVEVVREPRSGKVLVAAQPGGSVLKGALLDSSGTPMGGDFTLSSAVLSWPALTVTRSAQFALGYINGQGAELERLTLSDTRLSFDVPSADATVGRSFVLAGWSVDLGAATGDGVDAIHGWAFPAGAGAPIFLGATTPSIPRPDVAGIFGSQFLVAGFAITTPTLGPGAYTLVVYSHSALSGQFEDVATQHVTVASSLPQGRLEIPADGASVSSPFSISGWAIDRAAPVGSGNGVGVDFVHVWAIGSSASVFVGQISVNRSRPDIATLFGGQFESAGYQMDAATLAPGTYQLVAFAHSVVDGSFSSSNPVTVTVHAPVSNPAMSVDTPTANANVTGSFRVDGWAIDLGAPVGAGVDAVHVWAIPAGGGSAMFVGVAELGGPRSDIGALFGAAFASSGFSLTVVAGAIAPGQYDLLVYAHSTVTGTFNQVRVVRITVQ
jgi:hypothetical protein